MTVGGGAIGNWEGKDKELGKEGGEKLQEDYKTGSKEEKGV